MAIRNQFQYLADLSASSGSGIKVTGQYKVGETLTVKVTGGLVISSIQWVRLVDDVEVEIAGANATSYTLTLEDGTYKIYPKILAYTLVDAKPVEITPIPPVVVTVPMIIRSVLGEEVQYTPASFTGFPTPEVTNEWTIDGQPVGGITPIASIVGSQIILAQRASNSAGEVVAQSDPATVIIENPEDAIFSAAIVVPITDFLTAGEVLVTDGSADYVPMINAGFVTLNQAFQADGIRRQIGFPEGLFKTTTDNPNLFGYNGVGIKGAGAGKTIFQPVRSLFLTNPDYDTAQVYHEDMLLSDFEVDCVNQVIESGYLWYTYKAFFMRRCRRQYYKNVVAHDSLGTLFGLDFMDSCYFYDCEAYGSGRSTVIGSGPGAGFGISVGRQTEEICEFYRCIAHGNKTGGFYFELVGGATVKPTGIKLVDCIGYENYIGVDDCGCNAILIENNTQYNNTLAGVKWGANSVTSNTKGPINGRIVGGEYYGNGYLSSSSGRKSSGGVVFGYALREDLTSKFVVEDADIHDNVGLGIGNQVDIPPSLWLKGSTKLRFNGGSGMYFYHPTQLLQDFLVDDTVELTSNGMSSNWEHADGITLCCNTDNARIKASGGDAQAIPRQQSVVAFRGPWFTAKNAKVYGDMTTHTTMTPVRMEHVVDGDFTDLSKKAQGLPTSVNLINRAKNPSGLGTLVPTNESNADISVVDITDHPNGRTKAFRMTAIANASVKANFFTTTDHSDLAVGDLYCLTALVKCSLTGVEVGGSVVTSQSGYGYSITPDTITDGTWQRVFIIGRVKSSTFPLSITMSSVEAGVYLDITDIMVTKGPNVYDFFDGSNNGGTWTGTADNSTSTKTVSLASNIKQPLKVATQWNPVNNSAEARALPNVAIRWAHYIGSEAQEELVLAFPNWYLGSTSTGMCTDIANDMPIEAVSVECNSVVTPVTFSGARAVTLASGEALVLSDPIPASAFGMESLPVNQQLFIKMKINFADTTSLLPFAAPRRAENGQQVWWYDSAATEVSDVDVAGVFTSTGTAVSTRLSGYCPFVFGRAVQATKSICIRGDSISAGTGDSSNPVSGTGWFQRMVGGFTVPLASLNLAVHGSVALAGINDPRINNLYDYCTDGHVFYGTNDISASGDGTAPAAMLLRLQNIRSQMLEHDLADIGVSKILVRSASTDLWATEENQTINTGWGAGGYPDQLNALLDADTGWAYVLNHDSIRGTDPWKWKTNGSSRGYSYDGTHASNGGYAAMATDAVAVVQESMFG